MKEWFPVLLVGALGGVALMSIPLLFTDLTKYGQYKTCRYYSQSIERCVVELGWEPTVDKPRVVRVHPSAEK